MNGAILRITGAGGAQTQTDAGGRFLLENIPAGYQSLGIEGAGLAPTTVALTVIGGATVDIGTPPRHARRRAGNGKERAVGGRRH